MYNILIGSIKRYEHYKKVLNIEKRAGLDINIYQIFKRKLQIHRQYKRGYKIGKRAAQGYNIYLTFGSEKTITKNAEDSYKRYSMAMKHYNQVLCDEKGFFEGYNEIKNPQKTFIINRKSLKILRELF